MIRALRLVTLTLVAAAALAPSAGCEAISARMPWSAPAEPRIAWPATEAEAEAVRESAAVYDNRDIRALYVARVGELEALDRAWVEDGLTPEQRARRAHAHRHEARMIARALMRDRDEVAQLQARDRERYGDPDGPSFDYLVGRARDKGLTGDEVYESIVESAQRTNDAVNRRMGL